MLDNNRFCSFQCQCLACVQDWPKLERLSSSSSSSSSSPIIIKLERLPKGVSQTPGLRATAEAYVSVGNGAEFFGEGYGKSLGGCGKKHKIFKGKVQKKGEKN